MFNSNYVVQCFAWAAGFLLTAGIAIFLIFDHNVAASLPFVLFAGMFIGMLPIQNKTKLIDAEHRVQELEADIESKTKHFSDLLLEWALRLKRAETRLEDFQKDTALLNWLENNVEPPEGNSWREYLTEKIKFNQ